MIDLLNYQAPILLGVRIAHLIPWGIIFAGVVYVRKHMARRSNPHLRRGGRQFLRATSAERLNGGRDL